MSQSVNRDLLINIPYFSYPTCFDTEYRPQKESVLLVNLNKYSKSMQFTETVTTRNKSKQLTKLKLQKQNKSERRYFEKPQLKLKVWMVVDICRAAR